jgi:hypothetical protein
MVLLDEYLPLAAIPGLPDDASFETRQIKHRCLSIFGDGKNAYISSDLAAMIDCGPKFGTGVGD